MAGNQLNISNIINISVSQSNLGVGAYNTSNLALFSDEIPGDSFGSVGFKAYVTAPDVAIDFGTASKTYQMALAIFSQQPNILSGGGQLIVILLDVATETWAFSGVAASGAFVANYNGHTSASIAWNDTASDIQTKLQAVPGLTSVVVGGSIASQSVTVQMAGVYGASPAVFTFTSNTLATSGSSAITVTNSISTAGQTLAAAITASESLVQYFGLIVSETADDIGQSDMLSAAAVVQALNKIAFFVGYQASDVAADGLLTLLPSGSFSQSRGLYYGDASVVNGYAGFNAVLMMSAYAGLALSVNFSGSNTTITMNLKSLNTIQPDPTMTQTIYNNAKTAGADIYPSLQGDPAVISFGANSYYDQVYNLQWLVGALQVAGFNYLAQSSTKVPQTEVGMDGLKSAYRGVLEQGVTNAYIAPGVWNSPTTFGNQQALYNNIQQKGYYIFSQPIAQQAQTNRVAREAPLVQIALKEAGAIQSSSVIIYVNP